MTFNEDILFDWSERQDILSDLVDAVGLQGLVLSSMSLGAPWRVVNGNPAGPVLHTVTSGQAFFTTPLVDMVIELGPGDAVLLPNGGSYEIVDEYPGTCDAKIEVPHQTPGRRCSVRLGGNGPRTDLTCCGFQFQTPMTMPLLNLLPPLVLATGERQRRELSPITEQLVRESRSNRPGTEGIVRRLAELSFMHMLRSYFESKGPQDTRLYGALADTRVAAALQAIHRSLAKSWSVKELASQVSMSRAAFAQLFTDKVGISPMQYVHRCRMQEAMRLLRETTLRQSEIAEKVGYSDPTSFSRAFDARSAAPHATTAGAVSQPPRPPDRTGADELRNAALRKIRTSRDDHLESSGQIQRDQRHHAGRDPRCGRTRGPR